MDSTSTDNSKVREVDKLIRSAILCVIIGMILYFDLSGHRLSSLECWPGRFSRNARDAAWGWIIYRCCIPGFKNQKGSR